MRLLCATLLLLLPAACGGDDADGSGAGSGSGSGGPVGGGGCGGGAFDLSWNGGLTGQATGDCVVTVVSDGFDPLPGEYSISALEETGAEDDVALILRINRDTLAPIQAIFTPEQDVACNQSDVFMMGNFEGVTNFTQRDTDGFELVVGIDFDCSDESDTNPRAPFSLQLSGTISGSRVLD